MNANKEFDNIDVQFLFNLSTVISNYVGEMFKYASINKCDAVKDIINSIISDSLEKQKVITKLMIKKTADSINRNSEDDK